MSDTVEVHIDLNGETHPVGLCRYIAKRSSRASMFEYNDEWPEADHAFAIDPENLPLRAGLFSKQSNTSALPGAILRRIAGDDSLSGAAAAYASAFFPSRR